MAREKKKLLAYIITYRARGKTLTLYSTLFLLNSRAISLEKQYSILLDHKSISKDTNSKAVLTAGRSPCCVRRGFKLVYCRTPLSAQSALLQPSSSAVSSGTVRRHLEDHDTTPGLLDENRAIPVIPPTPPSARQSFVSPSRRA